VLVIERADRGLGRHSLPDRVNPRDDRDSVEFMVLAGALLE
jgi:hypothetical protein